MAFNTICGSCGAPSGHAVGLCPFCKTPMSPVKSARSASLDALLESYTAGNSDLAIVQVNKLLQDRAALIKNRELLLLAVKVLLETEAPKSRLASLLAEGLLEHPHDIEIKVYYRLCEARHSLQLQHSSASEHILKQILQENPKHVHAGFILGTHLFWNKHEPRQALELLETCVAQHPNFKRAWGCLGAIYENLGNAPLAQRAFAKFAALESNPVIIDMLPKLAA